MKLSTLATIATLSFASAQAMAKEVVFKQTNNNFETQVCYTAATEGLSAAKSIITENNLSFTDINATLTCNGVSVSKFAKKYFEAEEVTETEAEEVSKPIALIAKNSNPESKVCLDSLVIGENKARIKHKLFNEVIICNGKNLPDFVRSYARKDVVVKANNEIIAE